ncbi:MAG: NADH-quinone oxidoreductase subunit NuoE [Chloroflexi bacterium]|nr:NADH-quinone oxidoreductase subunit NuoE [Chloroflexota bacterium]MBU1749255.1 NADH-quinone oxidoreductase subunit NuoE [Chloroflexota bacterium]MBU1880101.1 NADH-quinone oxidoreductase subunit NuoE [Chloroflexota bacterium]
MNALAAAEEQDFSALYEILHRHEREEGALIPVLQDTQAAYGYLPREAIYHIAEALRLSPAQVYAVASFYSQFRFEPLGKHVVHLCVGTACHVRGSPQIHIVLENDLGIPSGETTPDGLFTLETVACVGACGLAPTMVVDGETHGNMTIAKTRRLLKKIRAAESAEPAGGEA